MYHRHLFELIFNVQDSHKNTAHSLCIYCNFLLSGSLFVYWSADSQYVITTLTNVFCLVITEQRTFIAIIVTEQRLKLVEKVWEQRHISAGRVREGREIVLGRLRSLRKKRVGKVTSEMTKLQAEKTHLMPGTYILGMSSK